MIEKKGNIFQISSIKKQKNDNVQKNKHIKIDWSIFDKIYCIHYLPYKERLESIKEELKRVGILNLPQFEFYYTVNNPYYKFLLLKDNEKFMNDVIKINWEYNNSTYNTGIDLCHLNIHNINLTIDSYNLLKICEANKYKSVLFLEDDIKFLKNIKDIKNSILNFPKQFDVVNCDPYIFKLNNENLINYNLFFNKYKNSIVYNMSCTALSNNAIQHIIKNQENILEPFDHYTWKNSENLNTYVIKKSICIQDSLYANRQNNYMRTDKNLNIDRTKYHD